MRRERKPSAVRRKSSLRARILLLFAVTWITVVVVFAGVAVFTQIQSAQNEGVQAALSRIALARSTLENTVREIDLIGIRLANSSLVRRLAGEAYTDESEETRRLLPIQVQNLLYNGEYSLQRGHVISLLLRCADGRIYTNLGGRFILNENAQSASAVDALGKLLPDAGGYALGRVKAEGTLLPANALVYRRSFSASQDADADLYIFTLNTDFLKKVRYAGIDISRYALLNDAGTILISDVPEWIGQTAADVFGVGTGTLQGGINPITCPGGRLLVCDRGTQNRYTCAIELSRSAYIASARGIILLVLGAALGCIAIFCALAIYLSRRLTDPLHKLGTKMYQTAGGDLSARFEPKYNDEIGLIGAQFDSMVDRLSASMEQLRATEDQKRRAELRALEMQINPHFLYNTLSSIVWLASAEKNDDVIEITKKLSNYLRLSLAEGREFIPLRDEAEQVRSYMCIQNYRYGDVMAYSMEIDEAALDFEMPKLLLQPLVENAIYHGVRERGEAGGRIRICARMEGDMLRLEVWDNGDTDAARCAELNEAMAQGRSLGIGTDTVNSRLRIFYGDAYALQFAREGEWTVARINIPRRRGGDDYAIADRG